MLVLSAPLLPSWKILIALFIVVSVVAWFLRRNFIRAYAMAQIALTETLTAQAPIPVVEPPTPLAELFKAASLEAVAIAPGCAAAGQLIGELALRTRTGASIVAIQRAKANLVNPGPEEEILASDQVLLLGTRGQIDAARARLLTPKAAQLREKTP